MVMPKAPPFSHRAVIQAATARAVLVLARTSEGFLLRNLSLETQPEAMAESRIIAINLMTPP